MSDVPAIALRGKAVDLPLRPMVDGIVDEDGIEQLPLVFSANVLADIEDDFGSITGWQQALDEKPFKTIRDTVAIALGLDKREVGARLVPSSTRDYVRAIGAAFAIANGVDPTEAIQLTDRAMAEAEKVARQRIAEAEALDESTSSDTPGAAGSAAGSEQTAPTPSSGA